MGTRGTMRGFTDPVVGLAEWIGRKVRNHDPLHEVVGRNRVRKTTQVGIVAGMTDTVFVEAVDGQRFLICVRPLLANEPSPEIVPLHA